MFAPTHLEPGQVLARDFRVVKALAAGGMGSVYLVEQLSTGRQRALKVMHPQLARDAESRARFQQEARVGDPRERDAFAPLVTAGTIDVFVVRSLRDADVKTLYRMGVTWDSHTTPSRRYIILSSEAVRSSLAHELGHYFGIQPHSPVKNNLMSYDREDDSVFLDAAQAALVKNAAHAFRTSGTLQIFGLTVP